MSRTLTVKQVNNYISGVFEDELILHDICVTGEISEYKTSANNTFIVLKEDDNILECYKYGKLETFEKGAKITIKGRIKYYPKAGKISLLIQEIKYSGEGQYHIEFQRLMERLRIEGLLENKNILPSFVKKIALITSSEGAVLHDFMSVITKEHSYIDVEVFDVSVQGGNAKNDIIAALDIVNKKAVSDVIIIARGGGSYQDLLPFNSEEIARAVFSSKLPVISAVGHETDHTLCDFCSVMRAPTPSIAAEIIAKINKSWFDRFYGLLSRLSELVYKKLENGYLGVSLLARKLTYKNEFAINQLENRVKSYLRTISSSLDRKLIKTNGVIESKALQLNAIAQSFYNNYEKEFCSLSARLDALSPLKLMAGGYAKVILDGETIKSLRQLERNKIVKVVLFDGAFTAKVIDVSDGKIK